MGPAEASEAGKLLGAKHSIPIHSSGTGLWSRENVEKVMGPGVVVVEPNQTILITVP